MHARRPPDGRPRVLVVAHDIHDRGGMERVTAEMIRAGAAEWSYVVVSGSLAEDLRPLVEWHRVRVPRRPFPLRFALFFVLAGLRAARVTADVRHTCGAIVPNRVDVATVHFCHAGYAQVERAQRRRSAPTPGRLNTALTRRLALAAERWSYRPERTGVLAAVSDGVAAEVRRHYPRARVVRTPNGVDSARFRPDAARRAELRERHPVADDELVVLFVGGDWARKGLFVLVDAVATAARSGAPVVLWVVGAGASDHLAEAAEAAGVRDRVVHLGPQPDPAPYYAAADCFALPSEYEAAPLVVLEAAATALPIVASPVSGVTDVVVDGETGLLVRRDATAIAAALVRLAGDASLRRRLGSAARERVAQMGWRESYDAVAGLYTEAVAS